jgi:methyl-accepting chemotaxis protein
MSMPKPVKPSETANLSKFIDFMTPKGSSTHASKKVWKDLQPAMPNMLDRFYNDMLANEELRAKMGSNAANPKSLKNAQSKHWITSLTMTRTWSSSVRPRASVRLMCGSAWKQNG